MPSPMTSDAPAGSSLTASLAAEHHPLSLRPSFRLIELDVVNAGDGVVGDGAEGRIRDGTVPPSHGQAGWKRNTMPLNSGGKVSLRDAR